MFLAQAFQNKKDYVKAKTYLNEALAVETDPAERQKLLVRIALVGLVSNDLPGSANAARQARDLNPEDGVPYFILLRIVGRFVQRFCRSGYLLGRIRYDGQSRRAAAERFGVYGACQERSRQVPFGFPQLGGLLLQRAAGGCALHGDLWTRCRYLDYRSSPLNRFR